MHWILWTLYIAQIEQNSENVFVLGWSVGWNHTMLKFPAMILVITQQFRTRTAWNLQH
jgi:hypothetical protein